MKKKQNGDKKRNSFFKIIKLIVIIFFVSFMLSIFSKCDADGLGGLIKVPDWWPDGWFDLFYKEEPDDSGNGDSSENTDGSGSIIEGDVTESGIVTDTKLEHLLNAPPPIEVTDLCIIRDFKFKHS